MDDFGISCMINDTVCTDGSTLDEGVQTHRYLMRLYPLPLANARTNSSTKYKNVYQDCDLTLQATGVIRTKNIGLLRVHNLQSIYLANFLHVYTISL